MKSIPRITRDILDVIDAAYSINDQRQMITAVMGSLEKLIPFTSAVFLSIDQKTREFFYTDSITYNHSANVLFLYLTYYAPQDPIVYSKICEHNVNKAFRVTDVISASRLADTEVSRDFHPHIPFFYVLGSFLGSQGDPVGALGLHRSKQDRDFSDKEKEMMTIINPYLSKSLHNIEMLKSKERLSPEVGVVVISDDGSTIYMNSEARRALNGRPSSVLPDPGLSPKPAFFESSGIKYRVRTAELGCFKKAKMIFLSPPSSEHNCRMKLESFNLSPRQKDIALLTVCGLSNREITEQLFITEQTVKDHLQDIFAKIGVHQRSKLIAKILGPQF